MKVHTLLKLFLSVFVLLSFSTDRNSMINKKAVDFSLRDLNGHVFSLNDFKGKVLVIEFWSTWSSPSLNTLRVLEQVRQKYKDQNVAIIGIAILSKEQDIPKRIQDSGAHFPILLGNRSLIAKYGNFSTIPNTFIIDRQGIIRQEISGNYKQKTLEDALEKILSDSSSQLVQTDWMIKR